jgi:hypothetical protein
MRKLMLEQHKLIPNLKLHFKCMSRNHNANCSELVKSMSSIDDQVQAMNSTSSRRSVGLHSRCVDMSLAAIMAMEPATLDHAGMKVLF